MDAADAFARQSQRSARYAEVAMSELFGSGSSGTDAAGLCAGMPRRHYLAARVRWGLDVSCTRALWAYLMLEAADMATQAKARNKTWKRGVMQKLCSLAVCELLEPARLPHANLRPVLAQMPAEQWEKHEADYLKLLGKLLQWSDNAAEYLAKR